MENTSNIFERIMKIANHQGFASVNNFATKGLNYKSPEKINRLKKEGSKPSFDIISDISNLFEDLNLRWLLTGEGQMILSKNRNNNKNMIPLFDGVTVGGTSEVAEMNAEVNTNEYIDAGDWFKDATAAMRVHGDSMSPEYRSGSIVALKQVNDKRLIVYGQDYVVETSEYRVIKRLQRSDFNDCWSCYSINDETYSNSGKLIHEPFDVPVDAVSRLYRVLGNVTRTESSRIVLNSN